MTRDSQAPKPVFPEEPEFLFANSMFAVTTMITKIDSAVFALKQTTNYQILYNAAQIKSNSSHLKTGKHCAIILFKRYHPVSMFFYVEIV